MMASVKVKAQLTNINIINKVNKKVPEQPNLYKIITPFCLLMFPL